MAADFKKKQPTFKHHSGWVMGYCDSHLCTEVKIYRNWT